MGWNLLRFQHLKKLCRLTLVAGLLVLAGARTQAQFLAPIIIEHSPAQVPGDLYTTVSNTYLTLGVGAGQFVSGAIGVITNPGNTVDPNNVLMEGWNQHSLVPMQTEPPYAPYKGGWVYMRLDGGPNGGGNDYLVGDINTDGRWILAPSVVGTHLEARWETTKATTGTGGKVAANPFIEVDIIGYLIHDTVRFDFRVKNPSKGAQHTVGLAFVQDINVSASNFILDGPLRLPNQPYLHHEVMLQGALIPSKWETFDLISPASGNQPARVHSLRGTLKPQKGGLSEPTPPTRFLYGRIDANPNAEGFDLSTGAKRRNLAITWEFEQYLDPTLYFDRINTANGTDACTVVYWDPQVIRPGGVIDIITYFGGASSELDATYPMSLTVSAPLSLGFTTDHNTTPPTAGVAPNPFTVSAFVQNLSDLSLNQITSIGPINLFINLPPGLKLAPGETGNKSVGDSSPGEEAGTSWRVMLDPANPRSGPLIISVSAQAKVGPSKTVQRTIEVPTPTTIVLKSNKLTGGLFEMKTFPLNFGGKTPSEVLGLPIPTPTNGVAPQVDVLQWDPVAAHYVSQNTWIPGYAYWVRYNPPDQTVTTKAFPINGGVYPPLDGSVQPSTTSYRLAYQKGWNQIGDPYIYEMRFSEIQVFDNDSLQVVDIETASSVSLRWLLPAVYHYDSSSPNTTDWGYELLDNFGFQMLPGEGYWIRVNKPNLQFIFPGSDTPGASVQKAAHLGVGLGSTLGRGTDTNWRLQLNARSASSKDSLTYIGVAPKATNQADSFKYAKPPALNSAISLDIVHTDWSADNGRYAQDLRAPGPGTKTWDLTLTSPRPNEEVTLTWPTIAASVPRNYGLTLVDMDTNERRDLRGTSSYIVNTGPAASRRFQIVAQSRTRNGQAVITSLDVIANNQTKAAGGPSTVSIHYTLSDTAETRLYIRDGRGRTVRTLNATTRAGSDGSGAVGETVWDAKDQQGIALPSGVYNVELVALGANGQRSRQVKPILLPR